MQETYARWYAMSGDEQQAIESPGAWLTKVASRICLDHLGSARARRERYVGEWVPEPLPDRDAWTSGRFGDTNVDPADRITLDESVTMAFLVALDSMTAAERVVLVLHDVFCYSFAEVAEVIGRTATACRQLASSARRRLRATRHPTAPTARWAQIVREFRQAWEARDIDALIGLLDPAATTTADGGGVVNAALRPVEGRDAVVRHLLEISRTATNVVMTERSVNGQPGLTIEADGAGMTVMAFDITGDLITRIWAVRNPEKLTTWVSVTSSTPPSGAR